MKVRVTVTLAVDPDAYADEYGVGHGDIRADLQQHAQAAMAAHFDAIGVLR